MKANMDYETLRNSMSVQDAARVLRDTNCYGIMDIAKNVILKALDEQMSSSKEPNKWIPVSERLPLLGERYKLSDDVLFTDGDMDYIGYLFEKEGEIFWHYYESDAEISINNENNGITAWMPLPAPYKPQESEGMI